jgi:hypothetical protein
LRFALSDNKWSLGFGTAEETANRKTRPLT